MTSTSGVVTSTSGLVARPSSMVRLLLLFASTATTAPARALGLGGAAAVAAVPAAVALPAATRRSAWGSDKSGRCRWWWSVVPGGDVVDINLLEKE